MLNKNVEKNIRILFPENAEDRTQRILKRLRDDKAKDEHVPGSLTWIGRCAVDHAAADLIERLETDNAQLLEKVDRFSKVAFEQNMEILGKQDVITKQERVRANLQEEKWQLEQKIPRWISVEERLPEDCAEVLIYTNEGLYDVAQYSGGERFWTLERNPDCWVTALGVTHWMLLPQPSKEETT